MLIIALTVISFFLMLAAFAIHTCCGHFFTFFFRTDLAFNEIRDIDIFFSSTILIKISFYQILDWLTRSNYIIILKWCTLFLHGLWYVNLRLRDLNLLRFRLLHNRRGRNRLVDIE